MLMRCILLFLIAIPLLAADTDWITRFGGKVERDSAGRIVAVNLRGSWINDVEMIELARLAGPRTAGPLPYTHQR